MRDGISGGRRRKTVRYKEGSSALDVCTENVPPDRMNMVLFLMEFVSSRD
jgi:hypothetical protein